MKKLSNRDWAIALVIFVLAFFLGFAVKGIIASGKDPVTVENPVNIKLLREKDSLSGVIAMRDALKAENDKKQLYYDSVIIMNNKKLKPLYDKIISLSDSSRNKYMDSLFKRSGIR